MHDELYELSGPGVIDWLGVRYKTILTPGGFEGFFADMAQGGFRIPEDMERIVACAARHSLRVTGPPLGAE